MSYLALTVKQPFATLMLTPHPKHPKQAYKPLEGRMWTTAYRGPVLIHTGQQKETALFVKMREHAAAFPPDYPMGVILGMAELVACRRPNASTSTALQNDSNALFGEIYKFGPKGEALPVWMNEDQIWLWEFRNPIKFKEPIPCKGKLRLWTPDLSLYSEIARQITFVSLSEESSR